MLAAPSTVTLNDRPQPRWGVEDLLAIECVRLDEVLLAATVVEDVLDQGFLVLGQFELTRTRDVLDDAVDARDGLRVEAREPVAVPPQVCCQLLVEGCELERRLAEIFHATRIELRLASSEAFVGTGDLRRVLLTLLQLLVETLTERRTAPHFRGLFRCLAHKTSPHLRL